MFPHPVGTSIDYHIMILSLSIDVNY